MGGVVPFYLPARSYFTNVPGWTSPTIEDTCRPSFKAGKYSMNQLLASALRKESLSVEFP